MGNSAGRGPPPPEPEDPQDSHVEKKESEPEEKIIIWHLNDDGAEEVYEDVRPEAPAPIKPIGWERWRYLHWRGGRFGLQFRPEAALITKSGFKRAMFVTALYIVLLTGTVAFYATYAVSTIKHKSDKTTLEKFRGFAEQNPTCTCSEQVQIKDFVETTDTEGTACPWAEALVARCLELGTCTSLLQNLAKGFVILCQAFGKVSNTGLASWKSSYVDSGLGFVFEEQFSDFTAGLGKAYRQNLEMTWLKTVEAIITSTKASRPLLSWDISQDSELVDLANVNVATGPKATYKAVPDKAHLGTACRCSSNPHCKKQIFSNAFSCSMFETLHNLEADALKNPNFLEQLNGNSDVNTLTYKGGQRFSVMTTTTFAGNYAAYFDACKPDCYYFSYEGRNISDIMLTVLGLIGSLLTSINLLADYWEKNFSEVANDKYENDLELHVLLETGEKPKEPSSEEVDSQEEDQKQRFENKGGKLRLAK